MAAGTQKQHQGAKARKAHKEKRNFRTGGATRGGTPTLATLTKYMRSGGAGRMAERKARNHGCGEPKAHLKPVDPAHSEAPLPRRKAA